MNSIEIGTPILNNISKYRKFKSVTQDDLAKTLNITRSYLSKMENQKFSPSPELMKKICDYFGVTLGQMFYVNENSLDNLNRH